MPGTVLSRRRWMLAAAALPAFSQTLRVPGKRSLLVHNDWPEDLETPAALLSSWLTPVDTFFVRQHLPRPEIDPAAFQVRLEGLVAKRLALSLDQLRRLPQHTVPATLECAGNGRAYYRPRIPGLQWTKGAIGNAEWRGPRVADVLVQAGVSSQAAYASFDGADVGVAQTPDFIRSIPLGKASHPATLLALEMNGQPLPRLHGGPVRLIVPGWDGASWVKWVSRIELAAEPHPGFYMNPAYRYPKHPVPPGGAPKPEDLEIIEGMAVKSFFTHPDSETRLGRTPVSLRGIAWAGEHRVTRVEVSTDGGARWQDAALHSEDYPFAWRLWHYEWKPARPGYHLLACRATDSAGRTQPIEPLWNPSGYLWNGIERVGVQIEG